MSKNEIFFKDLQVGQIVKHKQCGWGSGETIGRVIALKWTVTLEDADGHVYDVDNKRQSNTYHEFHRLSYEEQQHFMAAAEEKISSQIKALEEKRKNFQQRVVFK